MRVVETLRDCESHVFEIRRTSARPPRGLQNLLQVCYRANPERMC
jgi:hypothetical protein